MRNIKLDEDEFGRELTQSSADGIDSRIPTANRGSRGFRQLGGKCRARSLRPDVDAGKGTLNLTGSLLCETNGVINGFHQLREVRGECYVCSSKLYAVSQRRSPPEFKRQELRPGT